MYQRRRAYAEWTLMPLIQLDHVWDWDGGRGGKGRHTKIFSCPLAIWIKWKTRPAVITVTLQRQPTKYNITLHCLQVERSQLLFKHMKFMNKWTKNKGKCVHQCWTMKSLSVATQDNNKWGQDWNAAQNKTMSFPVKVKTSKICNTKLWLCICSCRVCLFSWTNSWYTIYKLCVKCCFHSSEEFCLQVSHTRVLAQAKRTLIWLCGASSHASSRACLKQMVCLMAGIMSLAWNKPSHLDQPGWQCGLHKLGHWKGPAKSFIKTGVLDLIKLSLTRAVFFFCHKWLVQQHLKQWGRMKNQENQTIKVKNNYSETIQQNYLKIDIKAILSYSGMPNFIPGQYCRTFHGLVQQDLTCCILQKQNMRIQLGNHHIVDGQLVCY